MEINAVDVPALAPPAGHYSHGLVVSAARYLFVAGQVPVDGNGHLVGKGDPEVQAQQVLRNLALVVEAAGADLTSVVKTTVYLTDLAHRPIVGRVRQRFFSSPPPTNTLLVVSSLAHPDFLVEIDAIVALPDPPPSRS